MESSTVCLLERLIAVLLRFALVDSAGTVTIDFV